MNIAPNKDGIIPPIYEERLEQIGKWLEVNGEAIFETKVWEYQTDPRSPKTWHVFLLCILLIFCFSISFLMKDCFGVMDDPLKGARYKSISSRLYDGSVSKIELYNEVFPKPMCAF